MKNYHLNIKFILSFILLVIIFQTHAQTVWIKAGTVFDGYQFLGSKMIAISNGIIYGIFDASHPIPDSAQIVDVSDYTVLPGFIDSHIHFMGASLPYVAEIEKHSFGKLASEGISLFPEHRLHLLMNGITSIVDMGAPLKSYQRIENAANRGKIISPEIYYPGPLITAPEGHPAGTYYTGQHDLIINGTFQVDDVEKAKNEVRYLARHKVDFIKIVFDRMWYLKGGAPRLNPDIAIAIVKESHKLGLKVIAHVGSEEEARIMADIGVDCIEHGFGTTSDSLWMQFKDRDISFTPTLSAYDHYAPAALPYMKKTIKRAQELNVPIVVGTDYPASYGSFCGDDIFKEMNLLEEIGISRLEVLRGATYYGAKKIGKDNETGKIEKGLHANLVLYEGLVDTGRLTSERIKATILNGNIIIDNGKLVQKYSPYFRTKSSMIFPYGFYDALSLFNVGISYTNFDLLNSGVSLYSDAAWSTRNMWSVNLQFFIPSPVKKTSLKASFHFDNLNRLFYVMGNNTLEGNKFEYGAISFNESVSATTTWNKFWKLTYSLSFDQFKTDIYENTIHSEVIGSEVIGSEGSNQALISLSFIYDSRDHQNNPWEGILLSVTPEFSPKFLGSTNRFERLTFDARGFFTIFPRNIFCARLQYRQVIGDAPFNYLPYFGGSITGRGYYTSRFSDRTGLSGQAEYRFPVWKIISGVAFYDIGQVQKSPKDFRIKDFHHSAGFGPRFSFGSNENSILGIDFGFSNEGMMVFFHAGHTF